MTPRDFLYWLQGYLELQGDGATLSAEQVKIVRDHIALAMTNVTSQRHPSIIPSGWQPTMIC